MELVETEIEGPQIEEQPTLPPRPERRRVSVSLAFTILVLVTTVVGVYKTYPGVATELVGLTAKYHRSPTPSLTKVSKTQLTNFAVVAAPESSIKVVDDAQIVGAQLSNFGRRVVLRFQLAKANSMATILITSSDSRSSFAKTAWNNFFVTHQHSGGTQIIFLSQSESDQIQDWVLI